MGAAEEERVDRGAGRPREDRLARRVALAEQRREGVGNGRLGDRAGQLAGFDQRHQRRRRVLVDLDRRVLVLDRPEVRVRADRRRRRDDPDPAVAGGQGRGRGTGPDDAQDRQVVPAPEGTDADRGGRVAGDHDRLHVTLGEPVERLGRERQHLLVGPDAVRGAGVVAQVDRRFSRRPPNDLPEHRQTAHAGVEDSDGTRIRHARSGPPGRREDLAGVEQLARDPQRGPC